ncbi:hypothetical protein EW026_g3060 [Hermanssonia centrifuga]|uniref:Uncharacterized protein n=1 Tax=Hermanssonia centrifuga TaxID=98765 RepID=A0A4S4KMF0_9APHY|nr:hypothetical protein EW026_g3060 [Hermanssonia centrifuga]
MPLLTQSDPGTENNGIANAQTLLRHRHDPSLSDSLQHKFKGNKGFEDLLELGVSEGWYDPDNTLERLVFHYTFIPWLQRELDGYVALTNDSKPRYNRHKVLPHGRPIEIFRHPDKYGTKDFSVKVLKAHLDEVRSKYAPPGHPVFHLVPPAFEEKARQFYGAIGPPEINRNNVWQVYQTLLEHFRSIQGQDDIRSGIADRAAMPTVGDDPMGEEYMEVLPLKPFRVGNRLIADLEDLNSESSEEEHDPNIWTDPDTSSGSSIVDK